MAISQDMSSDVIDIIDAHRVLFYNGIFMVANHLRIQCPLPIMKLIGNNCNCIVKEHTSYTVNKVVERNDAHIRE